MIVCGGCRARVSRNSWGSELHVTTTQALADYFGFPAPTSLFQFLHLDCCTGIWNKTESIKDPELRERAQYLPHVIKSAWADGTNEKYARGWNLWRSWCAKHPESTPRPADPFYLALYMNDLVLTEAKKGNLEAVWYGVRWGHITCGFATPTDHPFAKTAFEGAKRLAARNGSKNRKEPLDTEMLTDLVERFGQSSNIMHLRALVICLVGFAGFLRISELMQVQIKNIRLQQDFMTFFIESSKTDQHRDGETIYISRTRSKKCPVALTERYIKMTKLIENPENYLICRLRKSKKGHNADGSKPLSYTRIRETFCETIEAVVGKDAKQYCLHSLRSGGGQAQHRQTGLAIARLASMGGGRQLPAETDI